MAPWAGLWAALVAAAAADLWGQGDSADANRFRASLRNFPAQVADITPVEVEQRQKDWGDGVIELGQSLRTRSVDSVRGDAGKFVDDLYGHLTHDVLVRPSYATLKPFRDTRKGVVSWLIGGDEEFPEDRGFVWKRWQEVRFQNAGITLSSTDATAMGTYYFVDHGGIETSFEYTMCFFRAPDGILRLNLHFSSVPFVNQTDLLDSGGITHADVDRAQQRFVRGIVELGKHRDFQYVETFVNRLFAYSTGKVLFRPPDAIDAPFRTSLAGAYSYFAGGSEEYPNDRGFTTHSWDAGEFNNAGIILGQQEAWVVGTYRFWKAYGPWFEAEYSIGYERDSNGQLRINLFMASFPSGRTVTGGMREKCRSRLSVSAEAIIRVQHAWAHGIVDIGATYAANDDYRKRAEDFVDHLYAYGTRPVLYKPADVGGKDAFRTSREGAISYLVGGDPNFPNDHGFALHCWEHIRFATVATFFAGKEAMTVGRVVYAGRHERWRMAYFTMGFIADEDSNLRINVHHATFPGLGGHHSRSKPVVQELITEEHVEKAQEQWGDFLVEIAHARENLTVARKLAEGMVDQLYAFSEGQVLLRTIRSTNGTRFRYSRQGAISFLVGEDCSFPADSGLAVDESWSKVRFRNAGFRVIPGSRAHVAGTVEICCDAAGNLITLDYSTGYMRDAGGALRIFLHDMALPSRGESGALNKVVKSMNSAVGSAVGSTVGHLSSVGTRGTLMALLSLMFAAFIAALFVYFTCCWGSNKQVRGTYASAGGLHDHGGPASYGYRHAASKNGAFDAYGYSDDLGDRYEYPYGPGFAQAPGASFHGADRSRGRYARSAPGNARAGFAHTPNRGHYDHAEAHSLSAQRLVAAPSYSLHSPQPVQARRSLPAAASSRGSRQTGYMYNAS